MCRFKAFAKHLTLRLSVIDLKGIKQKKSCFILLKSWMSTPFETLTHFYRNAMDIFLHQNKILPLTQCSQKILNGQLRLSVYNEIFPNLQYISSIKFLT